MLASTTTAADRQESPRASVSAMPDATFWNGRRVLVTGHTGFKGSWLCHWLHLMGAELHGLALDPEPNGHFQSSATADLLSSDQRVDLRDVRAVEAILTRTQPDVVMHLGAQALVRQGYAQPVETFATNVLGTVHVLHGCRQVRDLRAVLVVTSDKCYRNDGNTWPMRESDPLGGQDPYSASKACAELVCAAYTRSYLASAGVRVATARAGNVVGGGDVCVDRLLPDFFRALDCGRPLTLRHPQAIRPWQHVLDALSGYLVLAQSLATDRVERLQASYNFAPQAASPFTVAQVAQTAACAWKADIPIHRAPDEDQMTEAATLQLDASWARQDLRWKAHLTAEQAVTWTVDWERSVRSGQSARAVTEAQITHFVGMTKGDQHGS